MYYYKTSSNHINPYSIILFLTEKSVKKNHAKNIFVLKFLGKYLVTNELKKLQPIFNY